MIRENKTLRQYQDTLDVLLDIEWGRDDVCPSCGGQAPEAFPPVAPKIGHWQGCALRALIDSHLEAIEWASPLPPDDEVEREVAAMQGIAFRVMAAGTEAHRLALEVDPCPT
jgi:hypothetical protein